MKSIEETIQLVQEAHGEQKYGDLPYIVHLMLVARHFIGHDHIIVALLHDTLEDTYITSDFIYKEYGAEIGNAVVAITKRDGEDYLKEYIPRVSLNELATTVKLADLDENIRSATYWYTEYGSLIPKYEKAQDILWEVIENE